MRFLSALQFKKGWEALSPKFSSSSTGAGCPGRCTISILGNFQELARKKPRLTWSSMKSSTLSGEIMIRCGLLQPRFLWVYEIFKARVTQGISEALDNNQLHGADHGPWSGVRKHSSLNFSANMPINLAGSTACPCAHVCAWFPQLEDLASFMVKTCGSTDLKICMFITAEMYSYTDIALRSAFQGAHLKIILVTGGFQCLWSSFHNHDLRELNSLSKLIIFFLFS